jgi:hypothetical protein
MKRWGCCVLMAGLLAAGLAAGLRADGPISVVMEDGSVVHGTVLGVDQGTVTIQTTKGKSVDLQLDQVKKAFDADGNAVHLGGTIGQAAPAAQAKAVASDSDDEEDQVVPRDRHRHRPAHRSGLQGRQTMGNVLFWTGTGVAVVGLCAALYGDDLETSATSTYYTSASSDPYYDYTISGYSGYYTYDQYTQYYEGQAWIEGGLVIGVIGVAGMITGLIVKPSAREMQQDALLDFHDGKIDLGMPPVTMDRTRGTRTTLAMVHF